MLNLPILYSFRRCPYAMRARTAIHVAQRSVIMREVALKDKPQALRDISPKATVPVLLMPEGHVLEQSLDIMLWALGDEWLTADAKTLIDWNDGEFKRALDGYKYPERHPEFSYEVYRTRGELFFKEIERRLQLSPFLNGLEVGALDWAILPFVRQFAGVNPSWFDSADYPLMRQWLHDWLQSTLFIDVMRVQPIWYEGMVEHVWLPQP